MCKILIVNVIYALIFFFFLIKTKWGEGFLICAQLVPLLLHFCFWFCFSLKSLVALPQSPPILSPVVFPLPACVNNLGFPYVSCFAWHLSLAE